ncbi:MAG: DNA polymerase III subunit delta [Ignavibacteria bacterium]|jgi:DNA polymerase-3 subunit delta|nr:DNA polymerase III subunit delta [Ignavibacteria bacterium]MCU7502625.1 DNA polymerase III subunit delta [Ignavibacteria bacterium]MCU7515172.1 DNA polymerase III subunit delta [Ignavibacteria bacterium]
MAKSKVPVPSIYSIGKFLKKDSFLPVYFFYGEDTYSIENAARAVEQALQPLLSSDFDKEVISGKERTVMEIIDAASAFPFGSGRKLMLVKDFDELKGDKKKLSGFANNPPSFTTIVFTKNGNISNVEAEPYFTFLKHGYLFEANELKAGELASWIVKYTAKKGKTISSENAALLMDMVGENRSLIEMQLQKILAYLGNEKEITRETIFNISSALKEFTIFDLQNAIGAGNRAKAMETAYNLLEKGKDILMIISMLTRYFTALAQVPELTRNNVPDNEAARIIGTHPFYYKDYKKAAMNYKDQRILRIARALYKADLTVKTTSTDPKTVVTILLAEIFQ